MVASMGKDERRKLGRVEGTKKWFWDPQERSQRRLKTPTKSEMEGQ